MSRPARRLRADLFMLALALLVVPVEAGAREESKIQIQLEDLGASAPAQRAGRDRLRGDVRTHLQGRRVVLKLRARGLAAHTDYLLLAKDTEDATEALEVFPFTSARNGKVNVTEVLTKRASVSAPVDPRGKFLVIVAAGDPATELLGGWLYGAAQDDGPKTKIKEVTSLAPDPIAAPSGGVEARYDMRPNGHGRLLISMRGVPSADYEVLVDGALVALLTPNRGGNAKADFRTRANRGKGPRKVKPHHKKQQLALDPRRKEIVVQLGDGTPVFAGLMLAQIEGLNACSPSSADSPLSGVSGAGIASLELEEDCETALHVEVSDVPAGSYDLYVDRALVGTIDAADDGSGAVAGFARFDPTPDAGENEAPLDFDAGSGASIEVFEAGADVSVATPVLEGALL